MRDPQREVETQALGEEASSQGARCGTRSQDWDHALRQRQALNRGATQGPSTLVLDKLLAKWESGAGGSFLTLIKRVCRKATANIILNVVTSR